MADTMIPRQDRGAFKLWRIVRTDGQYRNHLNEALTVEFVISAKTEQAARELACDSVTDERDSCVWLDRRKSFIMEIGKAADALRETQIITRFPYLVKEENDTAGKTE